MNGLNGRIWAGTKSGLYELSSNRPIDFSDLNISDISAIYPLSEDTIFCAGQQEVFILDLRERQKINLDQFIPFLNQKVVGIFQKNNLLYVLQSDRIIQYDPVSKQIEIISTINPELNTLPENKTLLIPSPGKILIGTSDGIFESTGKRLDLRPLMLHHALNTQHIHAITKDTMNTMWLSTNYGLYSSDSTRAIIRRYTHADGLNLLQFGDRLAASASNGNLCFAGNKEFVVFQPSSIPEYDCDHNIEIMDVNLLGRNYEYLKSLTAIDSFTVDPIYRHMKFSFASLDYWNPKENRMAYSLVKAGKPEEWIALDNQNTILVSGLRAGLYSLKVDGTNHSGRWNSETRELIIKVNAPIWQSRIAVISYAVFLVVLIYLIIYFRTKHLWKLNREYKEREIIAKQIEFQKEELSVKNKNITDSINYAKRIQMALMPSRKIFAKKFPDSFILHMPKDIVSGDFYWINEVGGRIYFAAVDCTGHGVPGAFMSIIGFELFRRITEIEKKKQPAEILNSLSKGFETIFQDVENITLRDGMDVAFCAVDKEMNVLEFAGAFNPLYLVRDNTITEIKGDRCSVGLDNELGIAGNTMFSDHVIQLRDGDIIYIFTDGFADQFGGPEGKKYKYRRFRHLLLALHQLPMERQVEFLQRSILDWKGDLDQVDDILVMGVRISK
jgi:serine phosphatase RsbU (regulator of sigma subunit)